VAVEGGATGGDDAGEAPGDAKERRRPSLMTMVWAWLVAVERGEGGETNEIGQFLERGVGELGVWVREGFA